MFKNATIEYTAEIIDDDTGDKITIENDADGLGLTIISIKFARGLSLQDTMKGDIIASLDAAKYTVQDNILGLIPTQLAFNEGINKAIEIIGAVDFPQSNEKISLNDNMNDLLFDALKTFRTLQWRRT